MEKNSNNIVSEKAVQSDLTQESSSDDWADPAKYGYTKTTAGWVKKTSDDVYTSVAKESHTTLLDPHTDKELNKDNIMWVTWTADASTQISATVDKNDIKKGNRILLSSTVQLYKDGHHFTTDVDNSYGNALNVIANGVKIGHIMPWHNNTYRYDINSSEIQYLLVVDQTLNMVNDLKLNLKFQNNTHINEYNGQWNDFKGITADKPAHIVWITNDSDTYNYTVKYDPNDKTNPQHVSDSNGIDLKFGQGFASGNVYLGETTLDPDKSFTSQNYVFNKVFKFTRPKSIAGMDIPNFKSKDFQLSLTLNQFYPYLTRDGVWKDMRSFPDPTIIGTKLADGLSVQQITEAAKNQHFVYSISYDGQSMLVGFNFSTDRDNIAKLSHNTSVPIDTIIKDEENDIKNSKFAILDHPDKVNELLDYSANWVKTHNGEPYRIAFELNGWPYDVSKPNVQTVSDVTMGVKNPLSNTSSLLPNGISFDASVYKQLDVKYIDDDNHGNVLNTDTFLTATGTDLTYNVKLGTDPTFNSATDIAFPKNFVLNQPATVHYGVVQDKNKPIEIHVRHLIKTVDGGINLDDYPQIKKALNGDSTRTFHITYPAGRQGSNPSTIVQSIHFIRSGKADFSTDSVTPSTLTAWVPVASTAKGVTITNGVANFDAITLPRVAGYKAEIKQNPQNKMMYLVSFVANPVPDVPKADDNKTTVDQGSITIDNKGQDKIHDNGHGDVTIEAPSDKSKDKEAFIPSTPSDIDVPNSKNDSGQDWQISSIKTHNYTVSNGKDEFSLPIIENRALNIIKANDQTLAFNYIKLNVPSNYVFTISKRRKMYQLSVLKQNNGKWQVVNTFKSHDYKSLMKELKKLVY